MGKTSLPSNHPRMPIAGQRPVQVIVLKEIAAFCQRPATKVEELPTQLGIAGLLQRGRDKGAIAAPHIGIRVSAKPHDVRIIGRDNGAPVVDLRA